MESGAAARGRPAQRGASAGLSNEKLAPAREPAPEYSWCRRCRPKRSGRGLATAPLGGQRRRGPDCPADASHPLRFPHETFAGCGSLERESQLLVRADGDLPPGTSVRFLRGGDMRGELDLGTLKAGETMREKLPGRVCSGVLRGKVQVQVLNKGQGGGNARAIEPLLRVLRDAVQLGFSAVVNGGLSRHKGTIS